MKSPYVVYLGMDGLNCSINCKSVANNGVRKASSLIIAQTGTMTTIFRSNTAAETGSKIDGDNNVQDVSGFLSVPCELKHFDYENE